MINNPVDMNTVMFNIQGKKLEELAASKQTDKNDEKLMKAAQNFEAVFVNKLLEIIDSTIERNEGFMSGGRGEATFRSLLNSEVAKQISSTPQTSFGFAEQIYKQMKDVQG